MNNNQKFNEIIDFAINGEKDAVQFYRELHEMTSFSEKKKLLRDMELMEKGHITTLEKIRTRDIDELAVPEVQNLHISDYIVNAVPTDQMSYQDILITAMKREEASLKLYNELAEKSPDSMMKKLLLKLASEEAKHKLMFEKIYDEEILSED